MAIGRVRHLKVRPGSDPATMDRSSTPDTGTVRGGALIMTTAGTGIAACGTSTATGNGPKCYRVGAARNLPISSFKNFASAGLLAAPAVCPHSEGMGLKVTPGMNAAS